jgi:hypothetical protein
VLQARAVHLHCLGEFRSCIHYDYHNSDRSRRLREAYNRFQFRFLLRQ